ncbi:hypothetical protein ILYODFUR_025983 [Ilyodon furcidens]|uniref:Uncharacterized protein n=1 Tax=Ilyodon furcidens TaxID=33524 RepID=A0ABV0VH80_9TELE
MGELSALHLALCLFGLGTAAPVPCWQPTSLLGVWLLLGLLRPSRVRSTSSLLLLRAADCSPSTVLATLTNVNFQRPAMLSDK